MKKAVIVLVVGFVVQIILSCDCHCTESHQCKYTYDTMTSHNIDNSGLFPIVSTTDTLPKASYGMKLTLTLKQVATCQMKLKSGSFFSEAWAECQCPPVIQYVAADTIRGISIVTLSDFDDQHPSSTDVSNYFTFTPPGSASPVGIPGFLQLVPPVFTSIQNPVDLDLFLITPPKSAGDYSFAVTITLSGLRTLTLTTKSAHLK